MLSRFRHFRVGSGIRRVLIGAVCAVVFLGPRTTQATSLSDKTFLSRAPAHTIPQACLTATLELSAPTNANQAAANYITVLKSAAAENKIPNQLYEQIIQNNEPFDIIALGLDTLSPHYRLAFQRITETAVEKMKDDPSAWREVQEAAKNLLGKKDDIDKKSEKAREETKQTYIVEDLGKIKAPFETELFRTSKGEIYGIKRKAKNKFVFIKVVEKEIQELASTPPLLLDQNNNGLAQTKFFESTDGRIFFVYLAPGPAFAAMELNGTKPPVSIGLYHDPILTEQIYMDERADGIRFVAVGGGPREAGFEGDRIYVVDADNRRGGWLEAPNKQRMARLVRAFRNNVWEVGSDPSTFEWNASENNFELRPVLKAKDLPQKIRNGFTSLSLNPFKGKKGELLLAGSVGESMWDGEAVIYDVAAGKFLLKEKFKGSSGDDNIFFNSQGKPLVQLRASDDGVRVIDVENVSLLNFSARLNGAVDHIEALNLKDGTTIFLAVNRDLDTRTQERWLYVLDSNQAGIPAAKLNLKKLKVGEGDVAVQTADGRILMYFTPFDYGSQGPGIPVLQIFGKVK